MDVHHTDESWALMSCGMGLQEYSFLADMLAPKSDHQSFLIIYMLSLNFFCKAGVGDVYIWVGDPGKSKAIRLFERF